MLEPHDEHNQLLESRTHPKDWQNPAPAESYNLVVIGAGTGGLVAAAGAAGLGAKVALVEKNLMGGDCLNFGCVPSKALISSARVAAEMTRGGDYGLREASHPEGMVDFPAVMERMRHLRAELSYTDSAERFRNLGVDVFLGKGSFDSGGSVLVDGKTRLKFDKAVIATGSQAFVPPIPGLRESEPLTNETIFDLTERPEHLCVIGSGPIGCELAQTFRRLGSRVTMISNAETLLPRDDGEARKMMSEVFEREGIELILGANLEAVEEGEEGRRLLKIKGGRDVEADAILAATGRYAKSLQELNLESAGVKHNVRTGVEVDDRLRTRNPKVYGVGDACLTAKFTHAADASARLVIQNALFLGNKRASKLLIPHCTYTDPEVAQVGYTVEEARSQGMSFLEFRRPLDASDRSWLEGKREGFVRVIASRQGRILGATIVAPQAGEMISQLTLAMQSGAGLTEIASTIYPYPTVSETIKRIADDYRRTKLTPAIKATFEKWLRWRRWLQDDK